MLWGSYGAPFQLFLIKSCKLTLHRLQFPYLEDGVNMSSVKKKRKYKIAKHKRKKRSRRDRHKGR